MAPKSARTPLPPLATMVDLLAVPEELRRHEVLDGELVEKEASTFRHGLAQMELGSALRPYTARAGGPGGLGWWLASEVTVKLSAHQIVRPDVAGWRRERMPLVPRVFPVELRPDWICEVCSDGDARRRDGLIKRRVYADYGVPHYWLLDLEAERLSVLRLVEGVYREVLEAGRGELLRAEPFDGLEIDLDLLLGDAAPLA